MILLERDVVQSEHEMMIVMMNMDVNTRNDQTIVILEVVRLDMVKGNTVGNENTVGKGIILERSASVIGVSK